jgi:hypothetical protein
MQQSLLAIGALEQLPPVAPGSATLLLVYASRAAGQTTDAFILRDQQGTTWVEQVPPSPGRSWTTGCHGSSAAPTAWLDSPTAPARRDSSLGNPWSGSCHG